MEENEYFNQNKEKSLNFGGFFTFLKRLIPFRDDEVDAEGNKTEHTFFLLWRGFWQWAVNIVLNGFFLNLVLATWSLQLLNPFYVVADGVTIFLISLMLNKIWDKVVDGVIMIKRA